MKQKKVQTGYETVHGMRRVQKRRGEERSRILLSFMTGMHGSRERKVSKEKRDTGGGRRHIRKGK